MVTAMDPTGGYMVTHNRVRNVPRRIAKALQLRVKSARVSTNARKLQASPSSTDSEETFGIGDSEEASPQSETPARLTPEVTKGTKTSRLVKRLFNLQPPLYENLLKEDSIRLLTLTPGALTSAEGFRLETVSLKDSEKRNRWDRHTYYALSYCWGSRDQNASIVCNGRKLQISCALRRALEEMLKIPMLRGKRIWIDQICVNQENLDERSHQVLLMKKIYSRAIRTVIWFDSPFDLGEGEEDAFWLAEKVHAIGQDEQYSYIDPGYRVRVPRITVLEDDDLHNLGIPEFSHPAWVQMQELLKNPYFYRMWIIQEVALSHEPPILICHGKVRDWEKVVWAGAWLKSIFNVWCRRNLNNYADDLFDLVYSTAEWDLASLLIKVAEFRATDPRDKIYALLSLASSTKNTVNWPEALTPDYTRPARLVYEQATAYLISLTKNLNLLALVNFDPTTWEPGVSSWMPVFNAALAPLWGALRTTTKNNVTFIDRPYGASKKNEVIMKESSDPNEMVLRGVRIGRVKWTAPVQGGGFTICQWLEAVVARLDGRDLSRFQELLHSLFRVLTYDGRMFPIPTAGQFFDYVRARHAQFEFSYDVIKQVSAEFPYRLGDGVESTDLIVHQYSDGLNQVFLNDDDQIILGPEHVQEGDVICVLFGGGAPFVLRPSGEKYIMLGECYIAEWMNGEVDDLLAQGEVTEDWFTLM